MTCQRIEFTRSEGDILRRHKEEQSYTEDQSCRHEGLDKAIATRKIVVPGNVHVHRYAIVGSAPAEALLSLGNM